MLLVVEDPCRVASFIGHVKRETSHAINRLLGRLQHTIWKEGYESSTVLDAGKAVELITYLYSNPQKANLVETIEDYPNLSSWKWFQNGGTELLCKRIPRSVIPKLSKLNLNELEQKQFTQNLLEEAHEEHTLFISPDAWQYCFADTCEVDPNLLHENIIRRVRETEQTLKRKREVSVLGAESLKYQDMTRPHTPKKHLPRMICLSTYKRLRIAFLSWYGDLENEARLQLTRWRQGDKHAKPPPGFFAPGGIMFANLNPYFTPLFV